MAEATLTLDNTGARRTMFGHRDAHLRLIEDVLDVAIHARGDRVTVEGERADTAATTLRQLYDIVLDGFDLSPQDVTRAAQILMDSPDTSLREIFTDVVLVGDGNRSITPKGVTQKHYVEAIRRHDLVFGVGPAGTGKTYLAMAVAVAALTRRRVKRIILTRPAVEAGERLGFLPGDILEKVNPYLRPLYDALNDMLDLERATQLIERGVIEVAPLAFMRGRTLNNSFIILDEAQNATREQMKMFLTRLGFGSNAVITGDVTQVDLTSKERSGLIHATTLLRGVEGIAVVEFTERDVVRHPLVRRIVAAYDREDARERARDRDANEDG